MSNQVKDMTWREVQERLREFPVVIVPIGINGTAWVSSSYWNRCLFGGSIG